MKKRLWLILILAGGLVFGSWLASGSFRRLVQVQAQAQQSEERSRNVSQLDGFDRINEKARTAKRGGLPEAHESADAVVDPYAGSNPIANYDGTMDEGKERLARAEVDYQQGRADGIPEDNVVRVVNARW